MKSNVCRIENGTKDLSAILRESEKVAVYNELTHKQALQLRLICEEIDGMLPKIIDDFSGDFWIEVEDGVCKVNASIELESFTADKKQDLIGLAKSKKNAAAVGIVGKIRSTVENWFLDEENLKNLAITSDSYRMATGYGDDKNYSYYWSLDQYRNDVKKSEKVEAWDELEKSVIASLADDVVVGVRGKNADIIVIKKFA